MKKIKTQSGITLIALIITILVLMILAVVTINSVKDGGIITHAQNASSSYKEAQIEEEINLYAMEYYMNNKRSMKEDTVDAMTLVCKETGVSPAKLTVHTNKNGSEYVLYRIDKVTAEERTILEQKEAKALRGDADLDGVLTQEDVKLIEQYIAWETDFTELQLEIANINGDELVDTSDSSDVEAILSGLYSYSGGNDYQ